MKKGIIILLGLVSLGSVVYAGNRGNGNGYNQNNNDRDYGHYTREDSERNYRDRSLRGSHMEDLLEDATTVEVEGNLELTNGELPLLKYGKTTYTLMMPWNQLIDLDVKDGTKVKLEGVEFNAPMNWDGSEKIFIVTKITIDGKTTTVDHDQDGGMYGFGHGMMGETRGFGFRN